MGESHAEFAERTVDILESKIDSLQETLYKEKLNYRLNIIYCIELPVTPFIHSGPSRSNSTKHSR